MEANELLEKATYVMEQWRQECAQCDDYIPDEIAICFAEATQLQTTVAEWVGDYGVEHFNGVPSDHMSRLDRVGEGFDVRFEFLRLPGRDWRFELMHVYPGGIAPLHEKALRESKGEPAIIHVSYKCFDVEEYGILMRSMPTMYGRNWTRKAEYSNTYGIFSYWSENGHIYTKPRVNLRDRASS